MNKSNYELSKYRIEKAEESLATAIKNLDDSHYSGAVNRSYYCIFNTIRAVIALDGFDSKKHSGVIAYFRQYYIKSKVFDAAYSKVIGKAFEIRNKDDYDDFVIIDIEEAKEQVSNTKKFFKAVKVYLEDRWNSIKDK